MRKLFSLAVLGALLSLFSGGCNVPKADLEAFNKHFVICDYENSAVFAETKISGKEKPRGEDLLWAMQLGTVERIRGDYVKSTDCFDKCEAMLKYYDEQNKLGDAIGSTVVNDNVVPYKGEDYDGIMINTYKALNFMAEGEMDLARVEFNRALDRQRRAKEKFNEEIQKLQSEIDEEQEKNALAKSNVENTKTFELLAQKYPTLHSFEAYPDFVNPFATYMAGVFFSAVGDYSKAIDLLKESYGMVGDNRYVAEDLKAVEEVLSGGGQTENVVWVIFENGLGPVKDEFRLDIPLFIATDKVKYVGLALPKLKFRERAHPYIVVEAGDERYQSCLLSDMDRVVQTEFSKDFEVIMQRAIISATAKAVAQYALACPKNFRLPGWKNLQTAG